MSNEIDESLYSRQLYVMGHEAQRRMASSSVLIVGLGGLGAEIAKNVILAGVKSLTVYDNANTTFADLSSQFYLDESCVGANRATSSIAKFAELNPYVQVSVVTGDLESLLASGSYSVVVLTEVALELQARLADLCHAKGIAVIVADTFGVFGNIFCDFGENFAVHDINGEPAASSLIASITQDVKGLVTVLEDTRHGLETGDVVKFTEILGMSELNNMECKVTVKDPYSFEIDIDTRSFTAYERNGYVNQIKQPSYHSFTTFSQSIEQTGMIVCDFVKFSRMPVLHVAFIALHEFRKIHGSLPEPGNLTHAEELFNLTLQVNSKRSEKLSEQEIHDQKKVIAQLSLCSRGQVSPIAAVMGGIVGQEVLKACSGKFMPIKQWFYYDASETLAEEPLLLHEVTPCGCRYDGQIMVYGRTLQEKLKDLNMFLVGAGAIGCEMIKNWAMMGIACCADPTAGAGAGKGLISITDMDNIEKSNLSRQFLFRNSDINCPKSSTAVRAAKRMNPALSAIAYENKVAPETETIFNDDFFESCDMICTALDNVEARLYIDQKCLFYQKPMLESGTLGAKGHTQVVVPHMTENYGATRDPPEKSIPVCTLKHFPNQIDHTLQWAREWFEEVYKQTPEDANTYLSAVDYEATLASQQNMKLDTLTRIRDALVNCRPRNYHDCLTWARQMFEDLFCNKIKQLLHNFPLDRTTPSGTLFWSGTKRPPAPLEFDLSDPLHMEFLHALAVMRAEIYQIPVDDRPETLHQALNDVNLERFVPQEGVKIATTDEEAKAEADSRAQAMHVDIDAQCKNILNSLPPANTLSGFRLKSVDFDKDLDPHMRVVAAVSNLRARNYRIPEADLHTSRGIAGKITPAIATTTALVTGAICLEIYKILQKKPVTQLMNTFINLALPLFTTMEPEPPKATKATIKGKEWKWTSWDRIDIVNPSMTVNQLITYLAEEYSVELTMLSTGITILYSDFMDRKKMKDRKEMTLKTVVETVTKKTIPVTQKYIIFEIIVNDLESGDEVEIPYLRFKLF